jgi:hypothetical protein
MSESTLPEWLNAALEEYKAHRTAQLEIEKSAQHTMTFGGATIGVLVAGGVNAWDHRVPTTLIFLVVIPLVAGLVVVQWSGQMLALGAKGRYLEQIEQAIRDAHRGLAAGGGLPAPLFTWERSTHETVSRIWWLPDWRWHRNAASVAFGIIAACSLVVGAYRGYHGHELLVTAVAVAEALLLTAVAIVLLRSLGGFYARASEKLVKDEVDANGDAG